MGSVHHIDGNTGDVETTHSDLGSPREIADVQVDRDGVRYVEYDRRPGLSTGVYTLRAGVADPQSPHREDEIYVVVGGAGAIELDGVVHPLRVGSMVSVPRDVEHRFVDITEDLVLAVVFGPPEGTVG